MKKLLTLVSIFLTLSTFADSSFHVQTATEFEDVDRDQISERRLEVFTEDYSRNGFFHIILNKDTTDQDRELLIDLVKRNVIGVRTFTSDIINSSHEIIVD